MHKWYWTVLCKAICVECPASIAWNWTIDRTKAYPNQKIKNEGRYITQWPSFL